MMKRYYLQGAAARCFSHRYLTLAFMGGLLIFTATLVPGLGGEFMPQLGGRQPLDPGLLPRTISLEGGRAVAPRLREVMASIPEIRGVMSHVGRPDDGTDVTSFFNLEFNVPLKPMEQWRARASSGVSVAVDSGDDPRGDPGRDDGEVRGLPRGQLQLLAVDPRQRRGGALGRQGGQLGQALRHRSEDPGGGRPAGRQYSPDGPGDRERRAVPHRRPAQPRDRDRPRPACARYGDQRRRRRGGRPGRDRRPCVLSDGRGREALRHRAPPAARLARRPRGHRPDPDRWPPTADGQPGPRIPLDATGRDPPAQARVRPTSTARTIAASSRSSSVSGAATSPRRSPRPRRESTTRRRSRQAAAGLPDRMVGRVRPDAGGQRPADVDRPAVDHPDHGPALHRLQLDSRTRSWSWSTSSRPRWEASGPCG